MSTISFSAHDDSMTPYSHLKCPDFINSCYDIFDFRQGPFAHMSDTEGFVGKFAISIANS
jgi:hypothetical protein